MNRALRNGCDRTGSVGPYNPTTGTPVVPAMCSGPLSPPMYRAARAMSAFSSARSNSPHSRMAWRSDVPSRARAPSAIAVAAAASEGPDVKMIRRFGSFDARRHARSTKAAEGQRRKGFPALTCTTITGWPGGYPPPQAALDGRGRERILEHIRCIELAVWRRDAERQQHVPLADDGVPRSERFRSGYADRCTSSFARRLRIRFSSGLR